MPAVRRPVAAALALALALLTGCTGRDEPAPARSTASSTPLKDVATDKLSVARATFCPRVAPRAVTEALGATASSTDSWANGDRTALAAGVTDVAHEYGCSWTAADGGVAQAWVFAPPVTAARAGELVRAAARVDGCHAVAAPAYGAPSVAVVCRADGGRRTTYQGLFGDAWLTCSLQATGAAPDLDRTGRWCVAVAQAASGS